eukprot:10114553-Lingulodinium_polyedra.AAC.1
MIFRVASSTLAQQPEHTCEKRGCRIHPVNMPHKDYICDLIVSSYLVTELGSPFRPRVRKALPWS